MFKVVSEVSSFVVNFLHENMINERAETVDNT